MQKFQHAFGLLALSVALALVTSSCATPKAKKDEVVSLAEVPQAVQKTIKARAMKAEVTKIEKCDENGKIVYEAAVTGKGKKSEITVSADGTLVRIEEKTTLTATPAAVRKTIEAQAGGKKVERVKKITENGTICYEAKVFKGNTKLEIKVASDGKLIENEDRTVDKD